MNCVTAFERGTGGRQSRAVMGVHDLDGNDGFEWNRTRFALLGKFSVRSDRIESFLHRACNSLNCVKDSPKPLGLSKEERRNQQEVSKETVPSPCPVLILCTSGLAQRAIRRSGSSTK